DTAGDQTNLVAQMEPLGLFDNLAFKGGTVDNVDLKHVRIRSITRRLFTKTLRIISTLQGANIKNWRRITIFSKILAFFYE
ncbi:MAG: hypothetical protein U9Q82_06760, partial [Chloroflexota bacterium]|nr:hypothetical protein [Chloroflexota bacterium]